MNVIILHEIIVKIQRLKKWMWAGVCQQEQLLVSWAAGSTVLGRVPRGRKFGFFSMLSAILMEMASTRYSNTPLTLLPSLALASKNSKPRVWESSRHCSSETVRLSVRSLLLPTRTARAFSHDRSWIVAALQANETGRTGERRGGGGRKGREGDRGRKGTQCEDLTKNLLF